MKRKVSTKLKMAIAVALVLGGSQLPTSIALGMKATDFVTQLTGHLESGDLEAAAAMLVQLQALGIEKLEINGQQYMIVDLLASLSRGNSSALLSAQLVLSASFIRKNQVIYDLPSWQPGGLFPVGSAG